MNTSLNIGLAGIHASSLQKNSDVTHVTNQMFPKNKESNFSTKNQILATKLNIEKNTIQQNIQTNNSLGILYHTNDQNHSMFVNILA